ncbi:MAG: CAP domain-containing protein [Hyphomicrobiaceae bacterium]
MSRVLLPLALGLVIAGCSLNNTPITASLGDGAGSDIARQTRAARQGALGGEPGSRTLSRTDSGKGTQVAMLNDRAPSGSFEKAPRGALADRDYSTTRLDPEKARDLINRYRKQHGLKPLKLNAVLSNAAKEHCRDLAKWDRISHFGSDGSNPWDRVKRAGYNARIAAENVGTGQISIEEVMKGWKESPGHNKNLLLADADHMGIALVQDSKTEFKTFWTLVLASHL